VPDGNLCKTKYVAHCHKTLDITVLYWMVYFTCLWHFHYFKQMFKANNSHWILSQQTSWSFGFF